MLRCRTWKDEARNKNLWNLGKSLEDQYDRFDETVKLIGQAESEQTRVSYKKRGSLDQYAS